jgi:hypothetical protein
MGTITVSYEAAAPFIRRQAAYAITNRNGSRTQKERAAFGGELNGLVSALRILMNSPEGKDQPGGIADEQALPLDSVRALREYLGNNAAELLGEASTP